MFNVHRVCVNLRIFVVVDTWRCDEEEGDTDPKPKHIQVGIMRERLLRLRNLDSALSIEPIN